MFNKAKALASFKKQTTCRPIPKNKCIFFIPCVTSKASQGCQCFASSNNTTVQVTAIIQLFDVLTVNVNYVPLSVGQVPIYEWVLSPIRPSKPCHFVPLYFCCLLTQTNWMIYTIHIVKITLVEEPVLFKYR